MPRNADPTAKAFRATGAIDDPELPELDWGLLTEGALAEPRDVGLVSCLCVTRGRAEHVARAVRCFRAQTYENRELVVVFESIEDEARAELEALGSAAKLVQMRASPKRPLGELRNCALAASRGSYVCCWDDDDWHAPRRLEMQLGSLGDTGYEACVLSRWLVLDEVEGKACVSARRAWEGSLVCRRELPGACGGYPPLGRGEDTVLVRRLAAGNALAYLERPELYVYVAHGANTWGPSHFQAIFRAGSRLGPEDTLRLAATIGGRRPGAAES